ncbi:MAG: lanthionine synthetase C family protein [Candidatus Sericytochromatia bacterium]
MSAALWNPDRHCTLAPTPWNAAAAESWLENWSQATLSQWQSQGHWALHPRDASDMGETVLPQGLQTLYCGAAGVWLALAQLAEAGICQLPSPLSAIWDELLARYDAHPDTGEAVPSWFLGDTALLTLRCLEAPNADLAKRLEAQIRANHHNPTREALWGAPGTMLATLRLWEHTGDPRWRTLFQEAAEAIWSSWRWSETGQTWLWEQDMYGQQTDYVGAGHGWIGNLAPLWRGQDLLSAAQRETLSARTRQGLTQLALQDGERANWPPVPGLFERMLLQWCHGAPGMITSLRHADDPALTPLLVAGGHSIVAAGPLVKGMSLCHGTDGNGFALLELYRRTGDGSWLTQARQFAMWALEQSQEQRTQTGQPHPSLFTGDAGLACYLLACLSGQAGMPGLDR